MVSALRLTLAVLMVATVSYASSVSFPAEGSQRLLEADIHSLQDPHQGKLVCKFWAVLAQVNLRLLNLKIEPINYHGLVNEPSVSISLDSCVATLPQAKSLKPVYLIKDGILTPEGKLARLKLTKSLTPVGPIFSGTYAPFTLAFPNGVTAPFDVLERMPATLTCHLKFCFVNGRPSDPTTCPVAYGDMIV